jgi:hypothetical protein
MQQKCYHVYFNLSERKTYKYVSEAMLWRALTYSFPKPAIKAQGTNNTCGLGSNFSHIFGGNSEIKTMYNV